MNEKQRAVLDELLSNIDETYSTMFLELAEYAAGLGYYPVRNKTHDISIDFRRTKYTGTKTALLRGQRLF